MRRLFRRPHLPDVDIADPALLNNVEVCMPRSILLPSTLTRY
jgi:hypothetical protein